MSKIIFKIAVNYIAYVEENTFDKFNPDYQEITLEQYLQEHPDVDEFNELLDAGYCYLERIEK